MSVGAGSLAFSPFLMNMRAHASGDPTKLPKRFVFVIKENGLAPDGIMPAGYEQFAKSGGSEVMRDKPLSEVGLPENMKAFEDVKDHVNIIHGLSNRIGSGNHGFSFGTLGVYPGQSNRALAPTIDGELSKLFPSAFPHLAFETKPGKMVTYPNISALETDKVLPFFANPALAYNNLFGTVSDNPEVQINDKLDGNLLDFMIKDVKRVQGRVSNEEKEKLNHYLSAFEGLTDRRARIAQIEGLKENVPPYSNKYTSDVETEIQDAQFDMATAALVAGLSNTILEAAGHPRAHFGEYDPRLPKKDQEGPLQELWA